MVRKSRNILLAEDNPLDVEIIKEAFKLIKSKSRLFVTQDGEEALDFLYHRGEYQDVSSAPVPHLILLDIRMPKMNGLEVLKIVKSDQELKRIPIIMLTVSNRDLDIITAYDHGANSYIIKPIDFNAYVEIIREIEEYWLTIVKLPP